MECPLFQTANLRGERYRNQLLRLARQHPGPSGDAGGLFARAPVRPRVQLHVPLNLTSYTSGFAGGALRAGGRLPSSSRRSRRPPRCPAGLAARRHNVLLLLPEARACVHLEGAPSTRLESRRPPHRVQKAVRRTRRHRPALPVRLDVAPPSRRLSIGDHALDPVVMNNPPPPVRLKSNPATAGRPCRWARKDRCCTSGKC